MLYRRAMRMSVLVAVFLVSPAFTQLVHTGPVDRDYCYRIENIRPNLLLHEEAHLVGSVRDQTNAPFQSSPVELRKYISQRKQVTVRVTLTDRTGHFDLGAVKPGTYRLLASHTRAFKQPSALQCPNGASCDLEITLIANPTDEPDASCPIR